MTRRDWSLVILIALCLWLSSVLVSAWLVRMDDRDWHYHPEPPAERVVLQPPAEVQA